MSIFNTTAIFTNEAPPTSTLSNPLKSSGANLSPMLSSKPPFYAVYALYGMLRG